MTRRRRNKYKIKKLSGLTTTATMIENAKQSTQEPRSASDEVRLPNVEIRNTNQAPRPPINSAGSVPPSQQPRPNIVTDSGNASVEPKASSVSPVLGSRASAASASTAVAGAFSIDQVEAAWPKVIEIVKLKRMSTGIFLSEAQPVEVDDSVIVLGLPEEFKFHKESLEKENNKKLVEDSFSEAIGVKVRVRFVVTQQVSRERSVQAPVTVETAAEKRELPDIITKALDVFDGGKIIRAE